MSKRLERETWIYLPSSPWPSPRPRFGGNKYLAEPHKRKKRRKKTKQLAANPQIVFTRVTIRKRGRMEYPCPCRKCSIYLDIKCKSIRIASRKGGGEEGKRECAYFLPHTDIEKMGGCQSLSFHRTRAPRGRGGEGKGRKRTSRRSISILALNMTLVIGERGEGVVALLNFFLACEKLGIPF